MADRPKALSPANTSRLNDLVHALLQDAEDDRAIAAASKRALQLIDTEQADSLLMLDDDELAARGWTRDELLVARHALKPTQSVPYALRMAHERYINRQRVRGERDEAPPSEAAVVVIPQASAELPPLEGEDEEDEP